MKEFPKISIVTPNFNQSDYLEYTIKSVLDQGYPNLEYIIIDGESTDASVDIIKKYESRLTYWASEKDDGMYHAISKGFEKSSGDIMGWINSDDILHPNSLFVLAKCFNNKKVNWLQGINTLIGKEGYVVATCQPYNIRRYDFLSLNHLRNGSIRRFGTVQQESTFWRRNLWAKAGGLDTNYSFASDFSLWMKFFRYEKMYTVDSLIGAFRLRKEQISQVNSDEYLSETHIVIQRELKLLNKKEKIKLWWLRVVRLGITLIPQLEKCLRGSKREHLMINIS